MTVADDRLVDALRSRGMRVTPQRLLIHRSLLDLDRHVPADQVLDSVSERLPNASLPTVYAALELFEELGIVRRLAAGPGPTLWDPRPEAHHHFVCRSCGAVEDLEGQVDLGGVLRAARGRGLQPTDSELIVGGLCARCTD